MNGDMIVAYAGPPCPNRAGGRRIKLIACISWCLGWVCANVATWSGGSAINAWNGDHGPVLLAHGRVTPVSWGWWWCVLVAEVGFVVFLAVASVFTVFIISRPDLRRGKLWQAIMIAIMVLGLGMLVLADITDG